MRVFWYLCLGVIPLLAGCAMPRPWRLPATTGCHESPGRPLESTLFITLRLPDCGSGILTRYRGEKLRYAATTGRAKPELYQEKVWFDELALRVNASV